MMPLSQNTAITRINLMRQKLDKAMKDIGYLEIDRTNGDSSFYLLVGALLGLGSPAGMLLIRLLMSAQSLSWAWLYQEWMDYALFYGYMTVGTVVAFGTFGYFLGQRSEGQQVDNATLRHHVDELKLSSVKDSLTGTFSRAYMVEHLHMEMEASRRSGTPLSIAMVDVDDFKRVNDRFGHIFGDNLLVSLVKTIQMNVRAKDTICRYGGDEFVIIMSNTDGQQAQNLVERIRQAVNGLDLQVSIGLVTFTGGDEGPFEVLRRVDERLYAAKKEGKNRVVK